ncbi:NUDIX hydrolase [Aquihabitans sp. G128]|uniref:NUDIX hydrolase n=1 Tax=Aquihabitans sp. G128 TaxID=2849779 RepID=UPI001C23A28E|nr:NUDIX hydrolase [Aquihabitans sp. G128]QXC61930.1 NUDIX hydrolase [Aquihabitans sp. G128]
MTDLELLEPDDPRLERADFLGAAVHQLQMADLEDPAAVEHRDTVLDFFLDHPDAAERSCTAGHLTGSALVVDAPGSRTLLMLHAKLGRWFQPGGHADGDANLAAVALREAGEETGIAGLRVALPAIDVDVHRVEPPKEPAHLHLDTRFLVVAPAGAHEQANEESLALRWVTEADLDALDPPVDESTRRLVRRGLALASAALG